VKVAHLNARSLMNELKIKAIEQCMKDKKIDILSIVETWNMIQMGKESKDFFYQQSPSANDDEGRARGVLIVMSKRLVIQSQPLFPSLGNRILQASMIHLKSSGSITRRLIWIAYYAPPKEKKGSDEQLTSFLNSLVRRYKQDAIMVAGDFNRSRF
jgi:hypothetical protein